jgi:hypothetical protein
MGVDKHHPEAGFIELEPLAIGAVDLVWVIIALAGLLLLFAGWVIFAVLNAVLGKISIFGAHPFGLISGLLQDAMKSVSKTLVSRLVAFAHFLYALSQIVWRPLYVILKVMETVWLNMIGLHHSAQSDNFNERNRALNAERQLVQQEQTDYGNLQLEIDSILRSLARTQTLDLSALEAKINDALTQSEHYADNGDAGLRVTIGNDVAALQQQMAAQLGQAEAYANQQVAGVRTILENEITNVSNKVDADLQTAEQFATGLVSGLGIGSITSTLTSLAGRLGKVETETAQCLDPLCDTVTPQAKRLGNMGKFAQNLEDLAIAALLVALAAEAVHDPGGVAHDIETVVSDVGGAVATGIRDLVGI